MKYELIYGILLFGLSLVFLSCEKDFKDIQKSSRIEFIPSSEAENFILKHTDSARIKSILKSPLVYDYANLEYPFIEFPKGIEVTMFDVKGKQSFIEADYAINFSKSEIIDLRGNVKVTSYTGDVLETSQLYYDRNREWIFTEKSCKLTDTRGVWHFEGFDAKSDLTQLEARNFRGSGVFEEN